MNVFPRGCTFVSFLLMRHVNTHVSARGMALLKVYDVNANVLFTEGCNFDVLVDECDSLGFFASRGGKFDWLV